MTKLPTYLNVLGTRFRIEVVEKLEDEDDSEALLGATEPNRRLIEISAEQSISQRYRTLVHEYIHAVLFVSGANHLLSGPQTEEVLVRALESGICQLIEQIGPDLAENIIDEHREE